MRNGKIAKMPEWVREKLNERLEKGESGKTILAWMNEELDPGLKAIPGFDGVPVSKQNLSQWRRGGFREWQMRRKIAAANSGMTDLGRTVEMAPMAENFLLKVLGHYTVLMGPWEGKGDEKFEAEVTVLRGLLRDAMLMQRAVAQADKLKEAIRRRNREREDLWGGGSLVETMKAMLRQKREERVEAELQRREDAKREKDLMEATAKEAVGPSGLDEFELVAPGQSESNQEAGLDSSECGLGAGVNAKAQTRRREDAMAREKREDAKGETDLVEPVKDAVGPSGLDESELVTPGQSESNQEAGLDSPECGLGAGVNAKAQTRRREDAMARERREGAKGETDLVEAVKDAVCPSRLDESGLVAPSQSESNQKPGLDPAEGELGAGVNAKNDGGIGEEAGETR